MDCLYETVATAWVSGLRVVTPRAVEGDLESEAEEELSKSLEHFAQERARLEARISELHLTVRQQRAQLSRAELRKNLIRSRGLKLQLATLDKKTATLEQNMEKIEEGKSNRLMLSSLQTVNKALKKMGHQVDLRETDQVISDLEENMQNAADVAHTLSGTLSSDMHFDDAELEAELGEILGEEQTPPVFEAPPPQENQMPAAEEPHAPEEQPEPAAA